MSAAATAFAVFEEEMSPPRLPSRPNIDETERERQSVDDQFHNWSAKELSIAAINATLALSETVGKLTTAVALLERKLEEEYEDTKTHELKSLRAKIRGADGREKWFKRIITAVVTAVVIAEALRWLGLAPGGHIG